MNDRSISALFGLLALAFAGLLASYWARVLGPQLENEATQQATLAAHAQCAGLVAALTARDAAPAGVVRALDDVLVYSNPNTKKPFFRGVWLVLDYEALGAAKGTLDLRRGETACASCFPVSAPLYAPSGDLIGEAHFLAGAEFFERMAEDVRRALIGVCGIALGLLAGVFLVVLALFRRTEREIAERRRAEEEARIAKLAAEEASRTKSDFLANMSHEIRTPMNAIVGMTFLARQNDPPARLAGYLDKIHAASRSLLRIINDILDFSKIEARRLTVEHIPFALEKMLENVMTMGSVQAKNKRLELILKLGGDVPPMLVGDPLRLEQVLLNLVSNAVKFTETGEVVVSVAVLEGSGESARIRFAVKDTGPGLEPEKQRMVFEAFTQADASVTRRFGGTGLGLAIARRLVELMGGKLEVSSTPGQGSEFWFAVSLGVEVDQPAGLADVAARLRGKRVLVVDDNASAREIFADMLRRLDIAVELAVCGRDALELVTQTAARYDAILVDWKMPDMDGIETIRRLREQPGGRAPVVAMVTAYDVDELRSRVDDLDVRAVMTKPVTPSQMLDSMMSILVPAAPARSLANSGDDVAATAFQGVRVLLVEDNPINQQVACELLTGRGCAVDVASNGEEALGLLLDPGRPRCDAVLMDLQMPVMDGIEATRRLRREPHLAGMPVIALTARALPDDRERCFAAGMTDYLDKPISPAALYRTLLRWIRPAKPQPPVPRSGSVRDRGAASVPLDVADGLARVNGNARRYAQLLQQFAAEYGGGGAALERAFAREGAAALRPKVHDLIGVGGNLGLANLLGAAVALQSSLREDREKRVIESQIGAVTRALSEALDAIRAHVTSVADEPREPLVDLSVSGAQKELDTLARFVDEGNFAAQEASRTFAERCRGTSREALADELAARLSAFDFDGARQVVQRLKGGGP